MGWKMLGKRIAFARKMANGNEMILGGCYHQYIVVDAMATLYLPDEIPFSIGAMHIVNPLTAIGLVQRIKDNGHVAAI